MCSEMLHCKFSRGKKKVPRSTIKRYTNTVHVHVKTYGKGIKVYVEIEKEHRRRLVLKLSVSTWEDKRSCCEGHILTRTHFAQ